MDFMDFILDQLPILEEEYYDYRGGWSSPSPLTGEDIEKGEVSREQISDDVAEFVRLTREAGLHNVRY